MGRGPYRGKNVLYLGQKEKKPDIVFYL